MNDPKPLDNDKFEKIREIYVESFPEKIQTLRECWANLNNAEDYVEPLAELRTEVHKIAGSSGSHQFDNIYTLAKQTEAHIVEVTTSVTPWSEVSDSIGKEVQQLVSVLESELLDFNFSDDSEENSSRLEGLQLSHRELVIFVISHRSIELSLLSTLLQSRGFTVIAFNSIDRAQKMTHKVKPSIVVFDLGDDDEGLLEKHAEARFVDAENKLSAVVTISRRDNVGIRKKAAQYGADAFFAAPINAHNLCSTLDVLLEARNVSACGVLLIDKQPDRIKYIENAFQSENIRCRAIRDVNRIATELVNFKPDLIMVAYDSEDSTWHECVKIIRLHESHFNMPVVCLLEDGEDVKAKKEALYAGVDDCMFCDEMQEDQFHILKQRVLRSRRANHLIFMDSLTGALNRDAFMERANEEISLAIRRNESVCLAMIDVDRFKQINDKNGHVVGDYVLRHIADYMNNRLRRSDVVGRYAGDEFLILLPDTDLDSAYLVLDMIRKNLVSHNLNVNDADVRVSISLGLVAARPTKPVDIETLIVHADKKLYEAKVAGRNTLVAGVV